MFSFLKNFFIKSNELCRISHHFLYTLILCILVFAPDIVLLSIGKINFIPNQAIICLIILFCFISSFSGVIIKILTLLYIFLTQIISVNYLLITGKQIESTQILNALTNIDKVFNNFSTTWWLIIAILLPFVLLVFYSIFFRKEFILSIFSAVLVLSVFGFLIYKNGIIKMHSNSKSRPTRMVVHNNLKTFPYFITHTKERETKIPSEFLKNNEITRTKNTQPRVILLVLGDNINTNDLHLFNKKLEKENTPRLEKIISNEKDNFYLSNSITNSIEEKTSISKLFNALYNSSNANKIVKEGKQNILNLAKKNGYKTHWFGYHNNEALEEAGIFADDVKLHSDARHFAEFKKKQDDYLIDLLKNTDISKGKHLIVLHLKTAKLDKKTNDYAKNYKHHGEVFAEWKSIDGEKTTKEDTYNNSILYLDYLLESFIEIAQRRKIDYTFFISLRGENLKNEEKTLALSELNSPFIIYSKNTSQVKEKFKNIQNITHYEFSKYLLNLIGYEIKNYYEEENIFDINNDILIDNDEHLMINRDKNGDITTAKKERLLDYYNNNKEKYKQFAVVEKKITKEEKTPKKDDKNDKKNNDNKTTQNTDKTTSRVNNNTTEQTTLNNSNKENNSNDKKNDNIVKNDNVNQKNIKSQQSKKTNNRNNKKTSQKKDKTTNKKQVSKK